MDAPSSGWEPIDPGMAMSASSRSTTQKPSKPRKSHKSAVPLNGATNVSSFPVTGAPPMSYGQPIHPNPANLPYGQPPGMGYGQPPGPYGGGGAQAPGMPYPNYYNPMGGYGGPPQGFAGQNAQMPAYFADPLANVAMAYGQSLAGQGKDIVNQNLEKWISISTLKFYFAVDTKYVARKLFVLFLPIFIRDWSIKFPPSQCVAPREEPNAPDLYVPSMAFVTYVLVTGVLLGTQNRFTPEHLGGQASEILAWLIVEILLVLITFYITNISSNLRFLHLLAFTGYKYVGMVVCAATSMFFGRWGYRVALIYASCSIVWFFLRSLKVYVLPEVMQADRTGYRRRLWALFFITALQPLMIWLLTRQICSYEMPVQPPMPSHL